MRQKQTRKERLEEKRNVVRSKKDGQEGPPSEDGEESEGTDDEEEEEKKDKPEGESKPDGEKTTTEKDD